MYQLIKKEQNTLKNIESKYYMEPPLDFINKEVLKEDNKKVAWRKVFDNLHDCMRDSQTEVEKLLEERQERGKITDIRQTRVSIVGNMFSNLIIYTFFQNKIFENIRENIYITSKPSEVKKFKEITTIKVGEETQKPDVDLIVYTKKDNGEVNISCSL